MGNRLIHRLLRPIAFAIDALTVLGASYAALWWDEKSGWLYAYNAEQLGFTLTALWFVALEAMVGTTPGRLLCRQVVVAVDGGRPRRTQLALRAFFFALMVLSPEMFVLPGLFPEFLLDSRQRFIGMVSLTYTVALLPFITVAISRNGVGLHDLLTNTRVVARPPSSEPVKRTRSPLVHLRWSLRVARIVGFTWVATTLAALLIDWDQSLSKRATSTLNQLSHYVSSLATSGDIASFAMTQAMVSGGEVSQFYFVPEGRAFLPGLTQAFVVPAPPDVVVDRVAAIRHAQAFYVSIAHRLPTGLNWLDMRVTNQRQFGFVSKTLQVHCLVNVPRRTILYAPREALADTVKLGAAEWIDSLLVWAGDSLKEVRVVVNKFKVDGFVGASTGRWRPLTLDLLARRNAWPDSYTRSE